MRRQAEVAALAAGATEPARDPHLRAAAPSTEEELGAVTGGRGDMVPDGEPTEGRGVRVPTLPYVPAEKERREHKVTRYPHAGKGNQVRVGGDSIGARRPTVWVSWEIGG